MSEVTVTFTVPRLRLSPQGRQQFAALALQILDKQARAGISASGAPFPARPGPVDLHHRANIFATAYADALGVHFPDSRAGVLQAKLNYAGIAPPFQAEFESLARPILDRELIAEGE